MPMHQPDRERVGQVIEGKWKPSTAAEGLAAIDDFLALNYSAPQALWDEVNRLLNVDAPPGTVVRVMQYRNRARVIYADKAHVEKFGFETAVEDE